jgi:hypothetical protein
MTRSRSRLLPFFGVVPCLVLSCAGEVSPRGDGAQWARQDYAAQLQVQTALLRAEVDNLRAALHEKDRRETELWQGYMMLMASVSQLMQQQHAQASRDASEDTADMEETLTPVNRPLAVKALVRAINRLNLTTEQKQSLIQLLSPPRAIDQRNPWTNVGVTSW